MAEALKNQYNYKSLYTLAVDLHSHYPLFQVAAFLNATIDDTWEQLELKERITKISKQLGHYLPSDYKSAIDILDKVVMNYGIWLNNYAGFFPTFVEIYGQKEADFDTSIAALARYTVYASSEFAVRPFILKQKERMMQQMYLWANHENELVRRLASEGCRPQLPWAQSLPDFKKDPSPILPILNQLKNDPSLHVRKSVANNLNDISKTHPKLVIDIAKRWYGDNKETD